jgi:hypothetical protein
MKVIEEKIKRNRADGGRNGEGEVQYERGGCQPEASSE